MKFMKKWVQTSKKVMQLFTFKFSNSLPIAGCMWAEGNEGTDWSGSWGWSSNKQRFRTEESCRWHIDDPGPCSSGNPWLPFPARHHLQLGTTWSPMSHQDATGRKARTNWWHPRDEWLPNFKNIWKRFEQTRETSFLESKFFLWWYSAFCFLFDRRIKNILWDFSPIEL